MIETIEGKKIGELNYNTIQNEIKKMNEPSVIKDNRLKYLEKALKDDLPGAPDESWRRTDLSKLKIKEYSISTPLIKLKNKSLESLLNQGLTIEKINNISQKNVPFLEKIITKIANRGNNWENKAYSSDIKETKFLALAETFFKDGIFIKVPKSMKIKEPFIINVTHNTGNTENSMILPQLFIYLEKGSSINTMVEYSSCEDFQSLSLGVTRVYIEEDAELKLFTFQNYNKNTMSFHNEFIMIEENAKASYDNISIGGKISLWENVYTLLEKNAEINVNKLISTKEKQFIGNKIFTEHYSPNTISNVKVKSALKDRSKTLFLGKILMPKHAQKSKGYETSDNLILGKKALAYVIPQLEIIADDVVCSHGGMVSSIDEEKLLYLLSRGIKREIAEKLLIKAFYQDILNNMVLIKENKEIKNYIINKLIEKLEIEFEKE